jgi:hypothetical protein
MMQDVHVKLNAELSWGGKNNSTRKKEKLVNCSGTEPCMVLEIGNIGK